jgi:hypothetical protein
MVHVLLTHVNNGLVSVLLVPFIVCHETNNTTLLMLKYFNKVRLFLWYLYIHVGTYSGRYSVVYNF